MLIKKRNSIGQVLVVTALLSMTLVAPCIAKDMGQIGQVYKIAERDGIEELKDMASHVDIDAIGKQAGKEVQGTLNGSSGFSEVTRHRSTSSSTRTVDVSYTLEEDVPDPKNPDRIMYPKGFRFNPLPYIEGDIPVLFIDLSDKKQMAWLKKNPLLADDNLVILATGGGFEKTAKALGRPFYYATARLVERLQIRSVPSLAKRAGDYMEVTEYAVQ